VTLDATQEIPTPVGVPANASGIADVAVDENGVVTATLTVSNLTGPATAAHIHSGFAGETGPVLVGLTTDDGGTTWTVPADAATLTAEQIEAFNNGGLYFNVHTEANAPGEIRGQMPVPVERPMYPLMQTVLSQRLWVLATLQVLQRRLISTVVLPEQQVLFWLV